jgi:hypothetical protein
MKTPFFNSPEKISALAVEARRWIGTPFMANSSACGKDGGVSCHGLPFAVFNNLGGLPPDFVLPSGAPCGTRYTAVSVMESFLDKCPNFESVNYPVAPLLAGDLLGFQIFRCVDHLGVLLAPEKGSPFIDVLIHKHAGINLLADATYGSNLRRVWRLVQ